MPTNPAIPLTDQQLATIAAEIAKLGSQEAFAQRVGMSRPALGNILIGAKATTPETLAKICGPLGLVVETVPARFRIRRAKP